MLAFCPGNDVAGNFRQLVSEVKRGSLQSPSINCATGKLIVDNSFRNFGLDYLYRRFLLEAIDYSRCSELINQARRAIVVRKGHHVPRQVYNIGLFDEAIVEPKDEVWKEAWRVTDALIIAMNEEILRARARFVLVTLTTPIQVDPDVAKEEETQRALGASDLFYTERRLRQLGKRFGFPVITLAEELQAAAVQRTCVLPWVPKHRVRHRSLQRTRPRNRRRYTDQRAGAVLTRITSRKSPGSRRLAPKQPNFPWVSERIARVKTVKWYL